MVTYHTPLFLLPLSDENAMRFFLKYLSFSKFQEGMRFEAMRIMARLLLEFKILKFLLPSYSIFAKK